MFANVRAAQLFTPLIYLNDCMFAEEMP